MKPTEQFPLPYPSRSFPRFQLSATLMISFLITLCVVDSEDHPAHAFIIANPFRLLFISNVPDSTTFEIPMSLSVRKVLELRFRPSGSVQIGRGIAGDGV
jgi:hypothetical protein